MNPVTLRRLLVFGVCAVGVGALYLAPALTGSSGVVAAPSPEREANSQPVSTAGTSPDRGASAGTRSRPATSTVATSTVATSTRDAGPATTAPAPSVSRPPTSGATAYDPRTSSDHVAPEPVTAISTGPVTRDEVTVSWPPATDDVGVLRYRVVLNGFTVATTRKTHATVRWFNDDLGSHVIQVRAVDAAGNESPSSPNLLVSRPTTAPTATPSPSATPTEPSPSPSATASSPQPSSSVAPNEETQPENAASAAAPAASSSAGRN